MKSEELGVRSEELREALRSAPRIGIGHWALGSAYGAVSSLKSQVAREVACGDVISYWYIGILVYWGRLRCYLSNISFLIKKMALQSNAYQNSSLFTLHSSLKKGVAKHRKPKFSILNSQFSIKIYPLRNGVEQ